MFYLEMKSLRSFEKPNVYGLNVRKNKHAFKTVFFKYTVQ